MNEGRLTLTRNDIGIGFSAPPYDGNIADVPKNVAYFVSKLNQIAVPNPDAEFFDHLSRNYIISIIRYDPVGVALRAVKSLSSMDIKGNKPNPYQTLSSSSLIIPKPPTLDYDFFIGVLPMDLGVAIMVLPDTEA